MSGSGPDQSLVPTSHTVSHSSSRGPRRKDLRGLSLRQSNQRETVQPLSWLDVPSQAFVGNVSSKWSISGAQWDLKLDGEEATDDRIDHQPSG